MHACVHACVYAWQVGTCACADAGVGRPAEQAHVRIIFASQKTPRRIGRTAAAPTGMRTAAATWGSAAALSYESLCSVAVAFQSSPVHPYTLHDDEHRYCGHDLC